MTKSITAPEILGYKNKKKVVMITAYDVSSAIVADRAGVDIILVGDSLAMVIMGQEDTLSVGMEAMVHHTLAASKGVSRALFVADMPFLSYQASLAEAVHNAGRFMMEGRAKAVKLEGGVKMAPAIEAIVAAGIPVMGHVGMTPQSVNVFGGFKVQGRDAAVAKKIMEDAKAVEQAGAFAMVIECVPTLLAQEITASVSIPTIGIGAGPHCDGQVLVFHDILGLNDQFKPKFVKRYAELGQIMTEAIGKYKDEVEQGVFPGPEQSFE